MWNSRTERSRTRLGRIAAVATLAAALLTSTTSLAGSPAAQVRNRPRATIPFKDARIKFEINGTDGDGGLQFFIDADEWKFLEIRDPKGKQVFESRTRAGFGKLGGTELFLETGEPPFTELPLAELLDRFPEGTYSLRATGIDGEKMVGTAVLSHAIPAGPRVVSPLEGGPLQEPNATTLVWETVPPPNGSPIVAYELLVVNPATNLPALPKRTLDVHMLPTATSFTVPPGFLERNTEYEWEVLAIEAGGNQTLSSSLFKTMP